MKKSILLIASAIISTALLSSCSSGNTSATSTFPELDGGRTQTAYTGDFRHTSGSQGNIQFDLQSVGGAVTGNVILTNTNGLICMCSGPITGTQAGSNITLTGPTCSITIPVIPTTCDPAPLPGEDCPPVDQTGTGFANYVLSGSEARLNGSFTMTGNYCSVVSRAFGVGVSNAGSISVSRL